MLPGFSEILARELPAFLLVGPEGLVDELREATSKAARTSEPPVDVRIVRGSRCKSKDGLLREFAAALQFPWYFGHNWDALEECLTDLAEAPQPRTIILVSRCEEVMPADDESFRFIADIMRKAIFAGLRVMFHASTPAAAERLAAAGVPTELVADKTAGW